MATTVSVTTGGGDMAVYDAEPDGAARGAVLVLQEAFGVNDHIEDVTRRFAAAGYRAVAPHLFHRSGDPVLDYGNFEKVMPQMQALTEVGFCMGGSVVFLAAVRRALGAGVTFYGGGVAEGRFGMPPLVDMAPDLQTPWLGLFGDEDQGIPVEQVEALRRAAATAKVTTEIVRYAGAGHGFHCDARPDSYHEKAAGDGWRRTLAWFAQNLAAS